MNRWEWALLLAVVATSLAVVAMRSYLPMNDASSHNAVVERHGYSANVQATPGQQPLRHLRDHKQGQPGGSRSVSWTGLLASDWDYYDYVLVQSDREHPAIAFLEERTTLVARDGGFRLHRILRSPAPATPSAW